MQGLDYVVAQAALHGIRLILTLTNYWPDYGRAHNFARVPQGSQSYYLDIATCNPLAANALGPCFLAEATYWWPLVLP